MSKLHEVLRIFGVIMLASSLLEALVPKLIVKRSYDWRSALASFVLPLGRGVTDGFAPQVRAARCGEATASGDRRSRTLELSFSRGSVL